VDSLSQFALGAGIGVAVLGRRTPVWKAALWGGICGTVPDLDALVDHGDPIRNMTFHRAESHSLLYLTLLSAPLAWVGARFAGEGLAWRRWWLATWLALFTHPLLDNMTVYGTQLLLPFTDHPFGIGSVFIIDPLYTVPLLLGLAATGIDRRPGARLGWNRAGLALSTAYLAWSVGAQAWVTRIAERELLAQGIAHERLLVTPTAFNTVLWRIVAMEPGGSVYHEGFHSLLDAPGPLRFDRFASDRALFDNLRGNWGLERIAWFSHGFFKVERQGDIATIADIRMGQEPGYTFRFRVADWHPNPGWAEARYEDVGSRGDTRALLDWLWPRIAGSGLPPPRPPP
jgi:inner membrane protein